MRIKVNGSERSIPDGWEDESLLQVLREVFHLTGAKFGCGLGQCGACTVLVDGDPVRSCSLPVAAVDGGSVLTLEGLSVGETLHPVQQAWLDLSVPQCGYCQAGQIMSAVAVLRDTPNPTDADIDAGMSGNLCRCGTGSRIRAAIHRAAEVS